MYFREDCVYYGRELIYYTDMEGKHPYNAPACSNPEKDQFFFKKYGCIDCKLYEKKEED